MRNIALVSQDQHSTRLRLVLYCSLNPAPSAISHIQHSPLCYNDYTLYLQLYVTGPTCCLILVSSLALLNTFLATFIPPVLRANFMYWMYTCRSTVPVSNPTAYMYILTSEVQSTLYIGSIFSNFRGGWNKTCCNNMSQMSRTAMNYQTSPIGSG